MEENTHRQFSQHKSINILAASACMIDFFCENMAVTSFRHDRKSTLFILFATVKSRFKNHWPQNWQNNLGGGGGGTSR